MQITRMRLSLGLYPELQKALERLPVYSRGVELLRLANAGLGAASSTEKEAGQGNGAIIIPSDRRKQTLAIVRDLQSSFKPPAGGHEEQTESQ